MIELQILVIFVFVLQMRRERGEQFRLFHGGQRNVVHSHSVIGQDEVTHQLAGSGQRLEIFFENTFELRQKLFR